MKKCSLFKRVLAIVLCSCFLFALTACGDDTAQSSSKKASSVASKTDESSKEQDNEPVSSDETSSVSSEADVQKPKVTIMPLGDSLTQGGQHQTSAYRGFLSEMLTEGGYNTVFVGSHDWSKDSITDGNVMHSGYGGATVFTLESELDKMTDLNPDIVLLMIGRNDNTQGTLASYFVQLLDERVVEKIYKMYPDTHIFLASVPPCRKMNGVEELSIDSDKAQLEMLPAVRDYVTKKQGEGAKISFVDMSADATGIVWQDFDAEDFVHPLPSGYEKIATQWYKHIKDKVAEIEKAKAAA